MKKYFVLVLSALGMLACSQQMPTAKDGKFTLQIYLADSSGLLDDIKGTVTLKSTAVLLESRDYFEDIDSPKKYTTQTDADGMALFENLPAAKYTLSAIKDTSYLDQITGNNIEIRLSAFCDYELSDRNLIDSVYTSLTPQNSLVINEIYYAGPINRNYYFYDQFVELYNSSDSTVYLDGLILCRARQEQHLQMETNDFLQAIYVFQFPGESNGGREYPVAPHEFVVVAQDAIDHSRFVSKALDLSGADWEFFTPFGGEIDNPAPNVTNILPEHSQDFMINLSHNAVILARSNDWYYGETSSSGSYQYVHIPLSSVIDVVEYASNYDLQKEITIRMDAGFAGVGMQKYSGKSVERREPGFDSNNSNIDFVIIDTPTPGYQH